MATTPTREEALAYIRSKVDQFLAILGTLSLRPEELDDDTLLNLDPLGIIAEFFRQVIQHLDETNQRLTLATNEVRTILDTLGAAIVVLDGDDRIEDCNPRALEWFFAGQDKGQVLGRWANEACNCAAGMTEIRTRADGTVYGVCVHGRDLQVVATRITDAAGRPAKTVLLFSDISQQKATERHLRLYSRVFSHVGEGILITDPDRRIVEVNDAAMRLTGYDRDELLARRPDDLVAGPQDAATREAIWHTVQSQGAWQGEVMCQSKDGRLLPLLQHISQVRDEGGGLSHHIVVMTDISSLKETQSRLDFLAHHDALTQLPNRLLFHDRLSHAIDCARRDGRKLALLFIDLDRFKTINDSLGHHIGDLLLVEAARRLHTLVRSADTLARLGGDEFVVLMETGASHGAATGLAGKIVAAFKQPFQVGGRELHIGCSIGVTLFPEDGDDAATLLKHADVAMYRAKEAGREGHVRFSVELSHAMREKLELDNALRAAVREGGFVLHYQPILHLDEGVRACEALLRWPGAPASARSPDLFIPAAEETRLILPLGEWVLRQALRDKHAWRKAGLDLDYVSVNISAVQLAQPDFPDRLVALLAECGVAGHEVQLELTENVLMADIGLCARVLGRLRQHGIRVAIDDFGTGYSSLAYLKKLPLDILKIDRSFVADIPQDANDRAIAAAIIGLAHSLGLEAVAEGIETVPQQDYLASVGCRLVQGYLHARPLPAAEFASYVKAAPGKPRQPRVQSPPGS